MPWLTIIILAVAALFTSILSAIIGMGGGILLLAVIFSFLPHAEAIPVHAVVQLFSNGTRVLVFLKNVHWRTFALYVAGMVPGAIVGGIALYTLRTLAGPDRLEASDPYLKIVVGSYVLLATHIPRFSKPKGDARKSEFAVIGFVAGAAALTVGAIGPLIAPVFARHDFVKERLIATKAVCQMLTHLSKIPMMFAVFGSLLRLEQMALMALVMIAAVIPGTILGRRILQYVSAEQFRWLFRVALTTAGLKVLLYDGLWKLVFAGAA